MTEYKQLILQRETYVKRLYETLTLAEKATADRSVHSYFKSKYSKVDSYSKQFESCH